MGTLVMIYHEVISHILTLFYNKLRNIKHNVSYNDTEPEKQTMQYPRVTRLLCNTLYLVHENTRPLVACSVYKLQAKYRLIFR